MLPNNIPLSFLNCHLCMLGGDWGVVSRGDRIYIYVIVRHGKIRSLRGQCVLTFFFFFFPREKVNFMLFVLLGGVREKDRKGFV